MSNTIQIKAENQEQQVNQIKEAINKLSKQNERNNNKNFNKPYLIGISGGSASGKTSVAQLIFKELSSTGLKECVLLSMDSYYKALSPDVYKNIANYNFDHPNAFDFDLITTHLNELLEGREIDMPIYNFKVSKREEFTEKVTPANLIIFEGILSLYDRRIRNLMDMKIFVDTDDDVRLARRIYRDIKERGRQIETIIKRYHKYVKPCFMEFIKPTRKMGDVIIPRGAENSVAIDLVSQHLKYQLSKRFQINKNQIYQSEINNMNIKLMDKEGTPEIGISSRNELFDPKYQFSEGKVIIAEDEEELQTLQSIFEDFMNDYLINNLIRSMQDTKNIDSSFSIFNQSDTSFASYKSNIIYFCPTILSEKDLESTENFLTTLEKQKVSSIFIACIFLSPKFTESILNAFKNLNIKFFSMYYSDNLVRYHKYITSGGVLNDEGDFSSKLLLFNRENLIEFFKKISLNYVEKN